MTTNTPPATFQDDWSAFRDWVAERSRDADKSGMWTRFIRDFDVHRNSAIPSDLRRFVFLDQRFRGYGLREQPRSTWHQAQAIFADTLVRAGNSLARRLSRGAEDVTGERALRKRGLWSDYVRFCGEYELAPDNLQGMKSYYVADCILHEAPVGPGEPFSFLEIGAGLGNAAAMLLASRRITRYVIVDLPEMLLNSSLALRALFPNLPIRFVYEGNVGALTQQGVTMCVPGVADTIPPDSCDIAMNVDSFQEMTAEQVAGYLRLVQRVVRSGGVFVNINRRKYHRDEEYDNNPLMYPYDERNKVRRWEPDSFMTETFNIGGTRADPWMLRVETVQHERG
jgi:hypothetical protein